MIPAEKVTDSEWNFTVGSGADLFERLSKMPVKLGDVAEKLFQGLVTSCDSVYFLEPLAPEKDGYVKVRSKATGKTYELETSIVRPLCKGSLDVRRYAASPSKYVLFPYDPEESAKTRTVVLISPEKFAASYPNVWNYLLENEGILRNREKGGMQHDKWYGYVYPKSVALFAKPKILTPSIASRAAYAFDSDGQFYFVGSGGGGGGGYGIILKDDSPTNSKFVLGLLNSSLADYFLKQISSPFQHGYYAYNRQYIEQVPIRVIDFANPVEKAQHDHIVSLVERMLDLHKKRAAALTPPDQTALDRQIEATDRQIDAVVYALYGLSEGEIEVVEGAG